MSYSTWMTRREHCGIFRYWIEMKKLFIAILLIVFPLGSQSRVLTKQDWISFYLRDCNKVGYNQVCRQKLEKSISHMNNYLPMITFQLRERKLPTYFALIPIIESNYSNLAVSMIDGKPFALGLWQTSWRNIQEYHKRRDLTKLSKKQILRGRYWRHPEYNTRIATWILKGYYKRYNDVKTTLYAYNAGSTAVNAWLEGKRELPKQTENFYLQFLALEEIVRNQKKYGIKASNETTYLKYVLKNKLQNASKWFN